LEEFVRAWEASPDTPSKIPIEILIATAGER
jgi:hypothetical protein